MPQYPDVCSTLARCLQARMTLITGSVSFIPRVTFRGYVCPMSPRFFLFKISLICILEIKMDHLVLHA